MNHTPDELLDRILTNLRETPNPTGLDERITRRVLQSNAQQILRTPSAATLFLNATQNFRIPAMLSAIAAILITAIITLHHPAEPVPSNPTATVAPSPTTPAVVHDSIIAISSTQRRSSQHLTSPPTPLPSIRQALLCDCDPLALAELQAPSQPAPRMPLTAQEKLLLRMARHNSPILLAELDAHQREAILTQHRDILRDFSPNLLPGFSQQPEPSDTEPTNNSLSQPDDAAPPSTEPPTNGDPQ